MEPRRSLEELLVSYELENTEREVIVEGRKDAAIYSWFFGQMGMTVRVYAVDDRVEISRDKVAALGQDWGSRGKVIAAAFDADKVLAASHGITFVIDADFDRAFSGNVPPNVSCLLMTDYTAIEMYACVPRVVEKFFKVALRAVIDVDGVSVLNELQDVTRKAFAARWTLKKIDAGVPLIKRIETRCTEGGRGLQVDLGTLIRDSIWAHGLTMPPSKLDELIDETIGIESRLRDFDMRNVSHGHDFINILTVLLKRRYANLLREDRAMFKNPEAVDVALRLALEAVDLVDEPLFQRMVTRVSVDQ
jgi:hypothetical protein